MDLSSQALVSNVKHLLHIFGILPKELPSKVYKFCAFTAHIIFPVGFSLSMFLNVFLDSNMSIMDKIFLGPTSLSCGSVCVRTFNFLYRAEFINKIFENVSAFELKNEFERELFELKIRKMKLFAYGISICIIVGVSFIFVSPLFFTGNNLPLPIFSPLNWRHQQFDFIVVHIYSCISLALLAVMGSLPDICVWYLMYVSSIHLEIIGERLKNIGHLEHSVEEEKLFQRIGSQELICNIGAIQSVERNLMLFYRCFSHMFLLQIVTSCVCVCSITFILSFASPNDKSQYLLYMCFFAFHLFDIAIIMFYGNEIILKSGALLDGVFQSNWIEMSIQYRKLAIVLMERLKRPQKMMVGKIFPIDLNTLTSILKTAYSTYNVLRSVEGII